MKKEEKNIFEDYENSTEFEEDEEIKQLVNNIILYYKGVIQ